MCLLWPAAAGAQAPSPRPPSAPDTPPSVIDRLGGFEDIEEIPLDDILNVATSIAAGRPQTLDQAPSIVSVITDDDIRRLGARTLEEVLRLVPGIEVITDNLGRGRIVVRGVPGGVTTGSSENVLVLFNGLRLNEDIHGGATIVNLDFPADGVKKVEVIRGPGSALYGAGAFLGVINIVTYTADALEGVEVSAGAGSFATRQFSVLFGRAGRVSVSGFVQLADTSGPRLDVPQDVQSLLDAALAPLGFPPASLAPGRTAQDRRSLHAHLSARYRGLAVTGRLSDEAGSGYIGFADALGSENHLGTRQLLLGASYEHALGRRARLRGRLSLNRNQIAQRLQPFPPGFTILAPDQGLVVRFPDGIVTDHDLNSQRWGAEATVERDWSRTGSLAAGLALEGESTFDLRHRANVDAATRLPLPAPAPVPNVIRDSRRSIASAYAQTTWNLARRRLGVTAGLRWDHYSDFGDTVNPRAGLVLRLPRGAHAKLLYGRAFRAPSFLELNFSFPGFAGNPDLDPAVIHTVELAFGYRRRNLRASLNGYLNVLEGFIVPERPFDPAQDRRFVNTPGLNARGVELELARTFGLDHAIKASYAYQDASERRSGRPAADVPRHLVNLSGTLGLGPYLRLTPSLLVRGQRSRAAQDPRPPLAGYALVNLGAQLRNLVSGVELSADVQNVLDREYRDPSPLNGVPGDYPRPGRRLFVRLAWKF